MWVSEARMRPSSAKAKGRRLQQKVVADILETFADLTPDDVRSVSMGASGEDVLLSPAAQRRVPLSIEAKNCERLNIWSALEQCRSNCPPQRDPCVIFSRNRESVYATVPWRSLLRLLAIAAGGSASEGGSAREGGPVVEEDDEVADVDEGDEDGNHDVEAAEEAARLIAEATDALRRATAAIGRLPRRPTSPPP